MIRHITFTCPQTGERGAAFVAGITEEESSDPYRSVHCTACGWFHAVDPKTGRVLGEPEESSG